MTSPTSDGPSFSERLEQRVSEHSDSIDRFSRERGLPEPIPRQIDHHINMSRSELKALSRQDLAEVAFEVSAYAYYLQDQVNLAQVRVDKLTHEINKIAYPRAESYRAYRFEDNVALAILDDRAARELADMRMVALGYQARWAKLGYLLSDLARRIDNVREAKHG